MATWEHTLTEGQSLSIGSQGDPSLSSVSEVTNGWSVNANGTTTSLLRAVTTQRPDVSMGFRISQSRPGLQHGFSTHGLGGNSIAMLSKGGASGKYEQAIAYVTAAKSVRAGLGDSYTVEALHWIQGEADQTFGTAPATYIAALAQLHADHIADIGAITGQSALPMICSQTATWAHYNNPASIGLAQLAAARAQAGVYLVGGQYQLEYYSDGLHMTNVGYYHLGELHARAHEAVIAGSGWAPFAPIATAVHPSYVDVQYHVPAGSLEFDTTIVPAQAAMGFSLVGSAATVTSATIVGSDTVRLGTSQAVTEVGARVGYGISANNGSVGLGNLCDGTATTSVYDGKRLANWAVHSSDDLGIVAPPAPPAPTTGFTLNALYYTQPDLRLYPLTFIA